MNIIITNKYRSMLKDLNLEFIKKMDGEFDANQIIEECKSFFFQRMILDITAIKNYKDVNEFQKLSMNIDMSKVILLLDDSPETTSSKYLSELIGMGLYNFTTSNNGIMYLYNNPNSYIDVAYIKQGGRAE